MATHTPGPWQVVPADKAESPWVIGDVEGGSIASCEPCGPWISHATADANARLIAAAPDMWAALSTIADISEGSGTLNSLPHIAKIARAAIAKAGA